MAKELTAKQLAALRDAASLFAQQAQIPQALVKEKKTGNYYVINGAQARRSNDAITLLAYFGGDGQEKEINPNPLVTFEVSAFRSGANTFTFVIWRLEDGEAVVSVGQGEHIGTLESALAAGNAAIAEMVSKANANNGFQVVK